MRNLIPPTPEFTTPKNTTPSIECDEIFDVSSPGYDTEFAAESSERHAAAVEAHQALARLADLLCGRSGQCYKVRAILFSLYNGKPTCLLEVVGLDWAIRKDLGKVILAFGYETTGVPFFYNTLKNAITQKGQWDWFIKAHINRRRK